MLQAILSARRRGVRVQLIVSLHANQRLTQLAQRSHYETLLAEAVEIYLCEPHFLHARYLTVDDDIALFGSTNMDIRSFALNSEIDVLICDPTTVRQLRHMQQRHIAQSHRLSAEPWMRRPLLEKGRSEWRSTS